MMHDKGMGAGELASTDASQNHLDYAVSPRSYIAQWAVVLAVVSSPCVGGIALPVVILHWVLGYYHEKVFVGVAYGLATLGLVVALITVVRNAATGTAREKRALALFALLLGVGNVLVVRFWHIFLLDMRLGPGD